MDANADLGAGLGSSERAERRDVLAAFERAVRREASALAKEPGLLWQQLYNRLQWTDGPVRALLAAERRTVRRPWLRLVRLHGEDPTLEHSLEVGGFLRRALDGRPVVCLRSGGVIRVLDLEGREVQIVSDALPWALPGPNLEWFLGPDGTVLSEGGAPVSSLESFSVPPAGVDFRRLALAAGGRRVAQVDQQGDLRVWAMPEAALVWSTRCAGVPSCLALDRDGDVVAWGFEDGRFEVADLERGTVAAISPGWVGDGRGRDGVCAVDDSGTVVALGDGWGNVEVWPGSGQGTPTRLRAPHEATTISRVPPLVLSTDGSLVAHAGFGTSVFVWSSRTGELIAQPRGLTTTADELLFAGDLLVGWSGDATRAWDLARGGAGEAWTPVAEEAETATIHPGGRRVFFGGDAPAVVTTDPGPDRDSDRASRGRVGFAAAGPDLECLDLPIIAGSFDPTGSLLAGLSQTGHVHVWDVDSGEELADLDGAETSEFLYERDVAVALAPSSAPNDLVAFVVDGSLYVWDWYGDEEWDDRSCGVPDALRWTPDGSFVVGVGSTWVLAFDVGELEWLEDDDAEAAVAAAFGGAGADTVRRFASVDPTGRFGIRRSHPFAWSSDVCVGVLDGDAEATWPAESIVLDALAVEERQRIVVATLAGTVAVLEPIGLDAAD